MSEVAGRMAVQVGARILEKQAGGKGILLSGVPGVAPGSVLVDVAIDQGGCIETVDHVTTHSEPTYVKFGVVHYAVANIPGAVPRTSTLALTNATLPYAVQLADRGWQKACAADAGLAAGLNVVWGHVTYRAVATALQLPYLSWQEAGLDS